ncbi:MAG TPA: TonB family protein [Labilithrix sp.]|nr:TonB family protein [Labilithrix sp.]
MGRASFRHWAAFLIAVHDRLHPVFADTYLASLCALGPRNALNAPALRTKLEIAVLADGSIDEIGVVQASGQPTFDVAAVESFERIAPLPRPDASMFSVDGRVHLHWQFSRDETRGCSTIDAWPLSLGLPLPTSKRSLRVRPSSE